MKLSHYHPFIASFTITVGLGLFASAVYAQNGGFVSDIPQRESQPQVVDPIVDDEEEVVHQVSELPLEIDLDEVKIVGSKPVKPKLVWKCLKRHELMQGGTTDTPTVKICEWVPEGINR